MSTKRVLIIDDEDDIREVTQVTLETVAGWQVLTAPSAKAGLELAGRLQLDAILLDVMMPEMDGPTVFAHLQVDERTRSIPVILLTAKVQTSEVRRFRELGVAAVIAKPFDPIFLADEIALILGWS